MKTYLIADIDVHDQEVYLSYVKQVPPFVAKHGGTYLVRAGKTTVEDGDWQPNRLVVLEFPSREKAEAFVADPEYAKVAALRQMAAKTNMVLVDGP